jgi:hypothetical protein
MQPGIRADAKCCHATGTVFGDEAHRISSAAKPSNSSERMPPGRLHHARSTNREAPLTSADTEPRPTFVPGGTKPYPSLAGFAPVNLAPTGTSRLRRSRTDTHQVSLRRDLRIWPSSCGFLESPVPMNSGVPVNLRLPRSGGNGAAQGGRTRRLSERTIRSWRRRGVRAATNRARGRLDRSV